MWTPDVYEGAPTTVTALMSSATKVAALRLAFRVMRRRSRRTSTSGAGPSRSSPTISLAIGNFAALVQRNVKRMLAYSSIAQAGFLLIGLSHRQRARRPRAHVLPHPLRGDGVRLVRDRRRARARARGARHARQPRRLRLGAAVPRRRDVVLRIRLRRAAARRAASSASSTSSPPRTTTAGPGS